MGNALSDLGNMLSDDYVSDRSHALPPNMYRSLRKATKKAHVLIFHNDEFKSSQYNRKGSAKDMERLREFFEHYRCTELDIHENKTKKQIQQKMQEISAKDFTDYSALIVFIMSHGGANDTIMASDDELYSFKTDVLNCCTSNQTLHGTPKLFVLQVCRGDSYVSNNTAQTVSYDPPEDVAILQSTTEGTTAYRHVEDGSFFMQYFLRLLHENRMQDMRSIFELLQRKFREKGIPQEPSMKANLSNDFIIGALL